MLKTFPIIIRNAQALWLLALAVAVPGQAATRFVAMNGLDAGDCTGAACATIAYAIGQADAGDTVEIADGVYTESIQIDKPLVLNGQSEAGTIMQAHAQPGQAAARVVTIAGHQAVAIAGMTIRHGVAAGQITPNGLGGGIFVNQGAALALANVTLIGNHADIGGGGVMSTSAAATLTNVAFIGNTAGTQGGGMYNSASSPVLTNVIFDGNRAGAFGGGMYNVSASSPVLIAVSIIGNVAHNDGGGMYNLNASSGRLTDVVIAGNESVNGGGGGLYNSVGSSPVLSGVTITGNVAGSLGAGIFNIHSSSPVLTNVSITGNQAAASGGGMYNGNSSPVLVNVLLSGNAAAGAGGIYNFSGSAPLLVNATISGNHATGGSGGGIYSSVNSTTVYLNSIIWGNTATMGGNQIFNSASGSAVLHYTLYDDGPGDVVAGGGLEIKHGLTGDPLFADAGNGNLRLLQASPAIDAGSPDTDLALFATDQHGDPIDLDADHRVFGGVIDLGAYEWRGKAAEDIFSDRFEGWKAGTTEDTEDTENISL